MGLLEPVKYGENFHEIYFNNPYKRKQADEPESKRHRKKKKKRNMEQNNDQLPDDLVDNLLRLEVDSNASKFAIYSAVRSAVLESEIKSNLANYVKDATEQQAADRPPDCCFHCETTCILRALYDCRCHRYNVGTNATKENESDTESISEETSVRDVVVQVPRIVEVGLKGLFELITDARISSPQLCTKALKALFDVIQGQLPESFKNEPNELMDPLYDLLLDMATLRRRPWPNDKNDAIIWANIGCSTLLAICVARGDTGKTLKAIAALIMSPRILVIHSIQLPIILTTLQRSIYAVALGKPTKPDFLKNGIPRNSLIDSFSLKNQLPSNLAYNTQPSIASNGKFIFVLITRTLLKIGTGLSGTVKGHVYGVNNEFGKITWIGFSGNVLVCKKTSKRTNESIFLIDTETLMITVALKINQLPSKDGYSLLFSDCESINSICTTTDDILVVKQLHTTGQPRTDLQLKLARKSFRTLGYAIFEDEVLNQNQIELIHSAFNPFQPKLPNDLEVMSIACGKEFGLVRSSNGKVYYYGKSASLGLKTFGKSPSLKMTELIVSKISNIIQVCVGHDGIHGLLLNDDGSVYFTGTSRRGEDCDASKRRQPKAIKPKKLSKLDNHFIVDCSCNNGTSAFVTKGGKLALFGKDVSACGSAGLVNDLLDQHIVKVVLGKAHCVALNHKGELFTFGLNNKGQCGRLKNKDVLVTEVGAGPPQSNMVNEDTVNPPKYDISVMCDFDEHIVGQGHCRICTVCRECTGYNVSCVAINCTDIEKRIPGANCSCGLGDAGCSRCGACAYCISFQETDSLTANTKENATFNYLIRQRSRSLLMRQQMEKNREDINMGSDAERDTSRVAPLPPQKLALPSSSPVIHMACGLHHTVVITLAAEVFTFGSNQYGQLGTGDLQPHYGPVQVKVPGVIWQIAAGSNHTVLLTQKGIVYTFGNHQKGQLGRVCIDSLNVGLNDQLQIDAALNDIQGNSSNILQQRKAFLWNCTPGVVRGIGPNYNKKPTWIWASGDQTFIKYDESLLTESMIPKVNIVADKNTILFIPQIPLSFYCLSINRQDGSCYAHSKNQVDFAKIIQKHMNEITQLASDKCNQNVDYNNMAGTPPPTPQQQQQQQPSPFQLHQQPAAAAPLQPFLSGQSQSISHNQDRMSQSVHEARNQIFDIDDKRRKRSDGGNVNDKVLPQLAYTYDSNFGYLYVFDAIAKIMLCYNVIASEIPFNKDENSTNLRAILSPELALPQKLDVQVSRGKASLHLLTCMDILTSTQDAFATCFEHEQTPLVATPKEPINRDLQFVSRFENFGGGWGYSGHSVEAIRFMTDTDILLCGFAMFGGRGEYTCKLKVFDLGNDGSYEKEGTLLSETNEIPYECPSRSKYNIMLPRPVRVNAGVWYLIWARIAGPSSDCGSSGQPMVTTKEQIVFNFKTSKKANNGTDVNSGQIPAILYKLINQENKQTTLIADPDPVHKISKMFANTVTKECFESLNKLLNYTWAFFKETLKELVDKEKLLTTTKRLKRLCYTNKTCLRLLRRYINEIYPNNFCATSEKSTPNNKIFENESKNRGVKNYPVNHGASTSKNPSSQSQQAQQQKSYLFHGGNNNEPTTPTNPKKINTENLQLAECIGCVRALLIDILCDDLPTDMEPEGFDYTMEILDECHTTFLSCFNAFYPTSTLKWNCLCELLIQKDKGILHAKFLSAIIAGLCNPNVKLRSTFNLLSSNRDSKSVISPSDNSGLPMLSSTESHQYPVLVEQMIYRTQQEKTAFITNSWTFKDVLIRLLDIVSYPIKSKIENFYNRSNKYVMYFNRDIDQKLVDNCCHLLTRVLSEIVYQSCTSEIDITFSLARTLYCTESRFGKCDLSRTWNTGNFGPDAISFSVDRPGVSIAGALVFTGTGIYEYQLELLWDTSELQRQYKWETLESTSGTYDQNSVRNHMAEIKFDRPVPIKEHTRYALRLCSQGARTCSGDAGFISMRGPCGTNFLFFPCDLSFNGTTPLRGQLPCILYYSAPLKSESHNRKILNELQARDTTLQVATDITKKCTELLIMARNTLAASMSPSDDKSPNSSNNTQTVDSEQNITPIEEHLDVTYGNHSNSNANHHTIMNNTTSNPADNNTVSAIHIGGTAARDFTKRIESFSKGIIETLKFDKRSTNPFEYEIEIGETEIHPKDIILQQDNYLPNKNFRTSKCSNGNNQSSINPDPKQYYHDIDRSGDGGPGGGRGDCGASDDDSSEFNYAQILELFENKSASMFHSLLPLVFAHIGTLAGSDPKSSVQILCLIKDILPHVAALNQLYYSKEKCDDFPPGLENIKKSGHESVKGDRGGIGGSKMFNTNSHKDNLEEKLNNIDTITTSNHYCIIESDHPYKSASINVFRIEFPPCVQWFTIEFDHMCGTAQPEDYLTISISTKPNVSASNIDQTSYQTIYGCNTKNINNNNNNYNSNGIGTNVLDCDSDYFIDNVADKSNLNKNVCITSSITYKDDTTTNNDDENDIKNITDDNEWLAVKMFNTPSNWTQNALVFPGHKVEISLETASIYANDLLANKYGFKCLIIGYDNASLVRHSNSCLYNLECELAYLGGMCSANLMKRDLLFPGDNPTEDLSTIQDTIAAHSSLLSKGLALSDSILTINQALDTYLPVGGQSNERQFLKDFVSGAPGSSGARLAAWLQPEPRLDPNKCELKPIQEPVKFGWPCQLTIITRDQYGENVYIPDLKVKIKATPENCTANGAKKGGTKRISFIEPNSTGPRGLPLNLKIPYEPTIKDKMCFTAITFMKPYQHFSFEELRLCSPLQMKISETLNARDMGDCTFNATWTPNSLGNFCLTITVDGIALEETYRVEVKEAVYPPPPQKPCVKKVQPNKFRKFISTYSAGLRIRSHPTLQSEQVGIIKLNGIISFVDEVENDDGIWVKLSTESIRQHCFSTWYPSEAWCLQYNQHTNRILLHEIEDKLSNKPSTTFQSPLRHPSMNQGETETETEPSSPRPIIQPPAISSSNNSSIFNFTTAKFTPPLTTSTASSSTNPFIYTSNLTTTKTDNPLVSERIVISSSPCSSTSIIKKVRHSNNPFDNNNDTGKNHDIVKSCDLSNDCNESRSDVEGNTVPSLDAVKIKDDNKEMSEIIPISHPSKDISHSPRSAVTSMAKSNLIGTATTGTTTTTTNSLSSSTSSAQSNLSQSPNQQNISTALAGVVGGGASKLQALHKWFKGDSVEGKDLSSTKRRNELSDLATGTVRDIVKAMGGQDSRSNGNDVSINSQQNRCSSPIAIPKAGRQDADSTHGSTPSKSIDVSDTTEIRESPIANELCNTSNDITTAAMTSSNSSNVSTGLTPSSHLKRSIRFSKNKSPSKYNANVPLVAVDQQNVNYNRNINVQQLSGSVSDSLNSNMEMPCETISNGVSSQVENISTISKKPQIEDLSSQSPTNDDPPPPPPPPPPPIPPKTGSTTVPPLSPPLPPSSSSPSPPPIQTSKRALPSSLAESLRAVFAAFLWHEGVVHDAMACASFLKFHPSLPKQCALTVNDTEESDKKIYLSREQRAQQRYSVEVANAGNYLNIRPSTLETLTKSGNSVLNRRHRKTLIDNSNSNSIDQPKLESLPEAITVCPPALRCLVYLWDQLCSNCVQVVQSNRRLPVASKENGPPVRPPRTSKERHQQQQQHFQQQQLYYQQQYLHLHPYQKPFQNPLQYQCRQQFQQFLHQQHQQRGNQQQQQQQPPQQQQHQNEDLEPRKYRKKRKEDNPWCELCEIYLQVPVTHHMRVSHPGCGKPAKGKGYNSVGLLCEGWAGNCGEGGKGASSWYLICDLCRRFYKHGDKNLNNVNSTNNKFPNQYEGGSGGLFDLKSNLFINAEAYKMMKDNALFLLELSSTGINGLVGSGNQKRSPPQQMPTVSETQLNQFASDLVNRPGTSRDGNIFYSNRNSRIGNVGPVVTGAGGGSKDAPLPCMSPELLWQAPEIFSCLESLGASMTNESPYEIFGIHSTENTFERPLSEISVDSTDPCVMNNNINNNNNNNDDRNNNNNNNNNMMTHSNSRFHRSLSMGQGWAGSQSQNSNSTQNRYIFQQNIDALHDQAASKVILRRRNNSTCEDGGSLLLCHPSENLRKLVPETIFNSNASTKTPAADNIIRNSDKQPLKAMKLSSPSTIPTSVNPNNKYEDLLFPNFSYRKNDPKLAEPVLDKSKPYDNNNAVDQDNLERESNELANNERDDAANDGDDDDEDDEEDDDDDEEDDDDDDDEDDDEPSENKEYGERIEPPSITQQIKELDDYRNSVIRGSKPSPSTPEQQSRQKSPQLKQSPPQQHQQSQHQQQQQQQQSLPLPSNPLFHDPSINLLARPTMAFIVQNHNLEKLTSALKRNVRIATCRIYALQALNWLLKSVTQTTCLHDLMWWFVSSLKPIDDHHYRGADPYDMEQALEHPVTATQLCGKISILLNESFHLYLQTVADLTLLLPAGTAIQQVAIQCFGIKFRQADHQFLHRSHVFGNISKILSKSDEQNSDEVLIISASAPAAESNVNSFGCNIQHSQYQQQTHQRRITTTKVSNYIDLQGAFDISVSSRPALTASLIDNSTETFWESDEEDKNKSKVIEISLNKLNYLCKIIYVHIDNSRDIQHRVTNIMFYAGQSLGDTNLIKSIQVEAKCGIWLSANIKDESSTHFRIELKGPENTLRVRQIKLLGTPIIALDEIPSKSSNLKLINAYQIQQRNCETETLRVFRLITAQVFGKLILGADISDHVGGDGVGNGGNAGTSRSGGMNLHHHQRNGMEASSTSLLAESLDLREHMVGILFSRSKLSHLQKLVIVHIVHAIKKESHRAKEEWEILNATTCFNENNVNCDQKSDSSSEHSRAPDTYCFEMLSMVLALSGSSVGRSYLSHQHGLLKDLLSLLHTGSDRVQRQVTALLRRMLPEITPEHLAELLGVTKIPSHNISIVNQNNYPFDMRRLGIIDIFLAVIAKSLQLQIKVKTTNATTATTSTGSNATTATTTTTTTAGAATTTTTAGAATTAATTTAAATGSNKIPSTIKLCNSIDLNIVYIKQQTLNINEVDWHEDDDEVDDETNGGEPTKIMEKPTKNRLYGFNVKNTTSNNPSLNIDHGVDDNNDDDDDFDVIRRKPNITDDDAKSLSMNQQWFLKGVISIKQAENIIGLIRDMTSGKLTDKWAVITKAAIAESILNLTRLEEVFRNHENCIKTPTLWLALASLCVLDKDHVEKLSSGRWSKTSDKRPICTNHDDGLTPAVVQCLACGALCGDCDRFLHLNRKTRNHNRTVCKEEEEAIRVELHESCGRTKLFWLLALADSRTLKAMVEFRDGNNAIIAGPLNAIGRCRFCGVTGNSGLLALGNVCVDAQCQDHANNVCAKTKACGHPCGGVVNESKCLPCLQLLCQEKCGDGSGEIVGANAGVASGTGGSDIVVGAIENTNEDGINKEPKLTQDADDMCMICFVEALSCAPAIQLDCGHVFHYQCCNMVLGKRWLGPRISFGFSQCPICKVDISHPSLKEILEPIITLKNDVKRKALMRLEYDGQTKIEHKDLTMYAMDRYAYYVCFKCQKAYYGGEARCDAEMGDSYNPQELVCGGCSDVARAQMCPKHGTDFLEYKCRYCCSVAVFFCFGSTHFCDTCHDDFQRLTNIPKNKLPKCPAGPKAKQLLGDDCPLHVIHPATGEEFALGCGICRNAQTF